jgi:hypothetical protein
MGNVIVDLSISPDGFIAGPDDGVERPPGAGDERLRDRSHKANDNKQLAIKNVLGDGDLAAVHSRILLWSGEAGLAAVHLFSFQSDEIIETWDCGQPVPVDSPNEDGVF